MTRLVSRCILYSRGTPSEPPNSNSSYTFSLTSPMEMSFGLTIRFSLNGRRATVTMPPLSTPGVMLVTLSMKRCVGTCVSFTVMSRLMETRYSESVEKAVPSTQSLCAPW